LAVSLVAAGMVLVGLAAASWPAPTTFWQRAAAGTAARDGVLELLRAGAIAVLISFLVAVVSLGLRWRRAGPQQRRLLSWTIFCTVSLVVALGLEVPATLSAAWVVAATALPAATLIAIVRYGLYDIDLIVHRSVLYGSLVLILTAVYIGAVLVAVQPFPEQTLAVHAAGTAAAVLAAAPLRRILQRRLDRWLYGDRARPYDVLSRLGQSLEHFLPPADVFPTVAACAAEALKLPYVGVSLDTASGTRVLVEHGRSRGWPQVRLAMTHRGTVVGELVAEARSPEERLGRRERRLLGELARQAAPAAQSVQLEQDLLRARERLVRAREDERLRIRRDLHDGVGPSLAGVRMQVDVARQLLEGRDERAGDLLGRAVQNLTATAKEVRRVVDGLRPPALDLGLLAALREVAARFSGPAFTVEVVTEGELGPLPAAVEVAAYRIAAEAVTNTARHARARHCRIGLRRDAGAHLALEIVDDGDGFGPSATAGCGTASMRERCAELGGTCRTTAVRPHGTRVFAGLPLTVPRPPEGAP
jgi:signal transduction histidine kinase